MAKRRERKNFKLSGKLKLKLSLRTMLIVAAGVTIVAAGVFMYVNFSSIKKSKAREASGNIVQEKPVDFNVPELKTDYTEKTIRGVRVRKAVDLTSSVK